MIAFAKLAFFGFIALSVVYIVVQLWSRRLHRAKLHHQWEEEGRQGDRAEFVRAGLRAYDRSMRPKLVLLVYVLPIVVIGAIIVVTNF